MDVDVEKRGDIAVVQMHGENLEASNVDELRERIGPVLEENAHVVFDMSQVRFIDSTACGLFLSLLKQQQKKGGGLRICCTTPQVESLFALMGFDKLFGVTKTQEDAVTGFGLRQG